MLPRDPLQANLASRLKTGHLESRAWLWVCAGCRFEAATPFVACPLCRCRDVLALDQPSPEPSHRRRPVPDLRADLDRLPTRFPAFDAALGGGLVAGSVVLLAGAAGIGKSTLALQVAGALARDSGSACLYVSGEESEPYIRDRCERCGVLDVRTLYFLETVAVEEVQAEADGVALLVVDSIQTMLHPDHEAPAGGVRQVLACTEALTRWAHRKRVPVLLLGRVTKDGDAAGPRDIQHLVDVVLYLDGVDDAEGAGRVLSADKNRFGAVPAMQRLTMGPGGLA